VAARNLNDRGEVLVWGNDETQTTPTGVRLDHFYIWRRGQIVTELKTPDPGFPYLTAIRINNRSEVVGALADIDPGSAFGNFRAFVWRRGHFTVLGPLPSTGGNTVGIAINDLGEVAGYSQDSDVEIFRKTFRWLRGRFQELPTTAEMATASPADINNRGQVIGNSAPDISGPFRGFLWSRKGSLRFLDSSMTASAMNDRGQIVGTVENRAALWEDGTVLDLGTLPGASSSSAFAINVFGTVVGAVNYGLSDSTAMVWRDGEMRDLNEMIAVDDPLRSRVHLTSASDINNFGWITANGDDSNLPLWRQHGYLLIPVWKQRH
jgi:probable HAF family extracellular repeat protein